jgi:hypothetical protein
MMEKKLTLSYNGQNIAARNANETVVKPTVESGGVWFWRQSGVIPYTDLDDGSKASLRNAGF